MKTETKFNLGDKVYYYIESINKYTWGKIYSIEVDIKADGIKIIYYVENRFYDPKEHQWNLYYFENYKTEQFIKLEENEIGKDYGFIQQKLGEDYIDRMNSMTELKKGILNR